MKNITKILIIFFAVTSFFVAVDITNAFTASPLGVCAYDRPENDCYRTDTISINVPTAGSYTVSGFVDRGVTPGSGECQAQESFDLFVDGQLFAHSQDPNSCETNFTRITESFPSILLSAGQHSVMMRHSMWNQTPVTAESVGVTLTFTLATPTPPNCSITANPSTINSGSSSALIWTSNNATSMTITQGIGSVAVNGGRNVSPTQTTLYRATVIGPGGVASCQTTVTVNPVTPPTPPSCTLTSNPSTIDEGDNTTLTLTSSNATSAVINQGIGNVPVNGSVVDNPDQTTTYTATVTGSGGVASCQTIVTVGTTPPAVAPTCSMSANPSTINVGGVSSLSWTSTNATSATINSGIGPVPVNGSISVSPNTTTTYTGTFTGSGGVVSCNQTVTVVGIPPSAPAIRIVLDDNDNHDDTQTIASGGTATFSVVVTNTGATSLIDVVISDALAPNCNRTATESASLYAGLTFDPSESFAYTCTRSGATASYTNLARVDANEIGTSATVNDTDTTAVVIGGGGTSTTCTMGFTPSSVNPGDVATLYWSSTNAITASIDQGVGTVNTSGALDIFRTSSATYTGTFNGPSETVICSATITVGGGGGGGGTSNPRISLSSGSYTTDEPSFIYLSQIPYTGVPQFLIAFFGYFFRFFFFGGLLIALYKTRSITA